jgi:Domain of unknown function (DUF5615)
MRCRFLLDENMDPEIKNQIRIKVPGIDIVCIGDPGVPPRSTLDPVILVWIEENNYILVSKNRVSMGDHLADHFAAGRSFPGLFWIPRKWTIGEIIEFLCLAWDLSEMEEYHNRMLTAPF